MPGGPTQVGSYVALLRGINVGGRNSLPMAELVSMVEALGASRVRTYIQSGNVVLTARAPTAHRLPRGLRRLIAERKGLSVPVVLRTAAELGAVVDDNPFLARGAEPKALHVAFLADVPEAAAAEALDPDRSPPDAFALRGRELFLHLPGGVARTKLTNAYLDRTLGTVCTVRNWRTVLTLARMAAEQAQPGVA